MEATHLDGFEISLHGVGDVNTAQLRQTDEGRVRLERHDPRYNGDSDT